MGCGSSSSAKPAEESSGQVPAAVAPVEPEAKEPKEAEVAAAAAAAVSAPADAAESADKEKTAAGDGGPAPKQNLSLKGHLLAFFTVVDTNKDQIMSKDEFVAYLGKYYEERAAEKNRVFNPAEEAKHHEQAFDLVCAKFDANSDGNITRDEFCACLGDSPELEEPMSDAVAQKMAECWPLTNEVVAGDDAPGVL